MFHFSEKLINYLFVLSYDFAIVKLAESFHVTHSLGFPVVYKYSYTFTTVYWNGV